MKTTLDISGPLLDAARKIAARDGETLSALVEQGRARWCGTFRRAKPFRLRDMSVGTPGARSAYARFRRTRSEP